MTANKKNDVSVLNWIGTLILFAIPGVNLIADICFLIFAKSRSKRTFAIAWLLLLLLTVIVIVALLVVFPDRCVWLANELRTYAAMIGTATAAAPVVMP